MRGFSAYLMRSANHVTAPRGLSLVNYPMSGLTACYLCKTTHYRIVNHFRISKSKYHILTQIKNNFWFGEHHTICISVTTSRRKKYYKASHFN